MNVLELFHENARAHPAAAAIIAGKAGRETVLSFGELDLRSRKLATLLMRDGLQAGDAVAVFVPMSPALYVILAALLRVGALPVFADPAAAREALVHAQSHLPLRGFIGIPVACAWRLFTPELRRIAMVWVAGPLFPGARSLRAADGLPPCDHIADMQPDAPAVVTFTSGTSGRPKGVIRSHGVLAETHRILSGHLGIAPGEIDVAVLPFVVFANLAAGAGSLIPDADLRRPGAIDAARLASQVRAWSPTGIVASPSLLERIADEASANGAALDSLRRVFAGGAPVFPHVLDKLAVAAPHARIHAIYGATEAEPIATLSRDELGEDDRAATRHGQGLLAGRPVPEVRLRILRDRFGEPLGPWTGAELDEATVPAGDAGEIVVCGKHVVAGYLGGAGDRELKIRVGPDTWHRTGDAGRLDAQGRLWLLGSCKARVADARGCRYPLAVDAALAEGPWASRATLVREAERVLLVVEVRGTADEDSLVAAARDVAWAGVDEVVSMDRLPRDRRHDAKIDQPRLRELLEAERWSHRVPLAGQDLAGPGGQRGG